MRGSAAFRVGVAPGGALAPSWVRDSISRAARSAPSLDLRFADNKSLVDAVSGGSLVTFTRASSGTYVGSDGLIKTATTNLLLRSEEFNVSPWTVARCTISANTTAAPNGSITADTLVEDTTSNSHPIYVTTSSLANATAYTASVYVKASTRDRVRLVLFGTAFSGGPYVDFNLPSLTATGASGGTGAIVAVGSGWYRCSLTATSGASGTTDVYIQPLNASGNPIYLGNGSDALHLWGAQLEQSSTVGEYVKTTTAINSAPRFDHNPTTGESLGLLVEESRTNLALQSEDFGTTWTNSSSTDSTNTAVAPDGLTTADTLIPNNGATAGLIRQNLTLLDSTTYTFSVFAKAAGLISLNIDFYNKANTFYGTKTLNLSNGTLSGTDFVGTSSVVAYSNGWYRFIFTNLSSGTGATTPNIRIVCTSTGDGTSGIYLWGAQLEAGAFPTSYIPTTTAAVTRSADVASITGANFSSWYRQDEGTVFAQASSQSTSAKNAVIAQSDSNGSSEIFSLFHQTDEQAVVRLRLSNSDVFAYGFGTLVDSTAYKAAGAYRTLNSAASLNGANVVASAASFSDPTTFSVFRIGTNQVSGEHINGTIRRLTYWPTRLPNETLQTITQ